MKILFITHDASRTGAPIVLLHFLRWLQEHQPDVQVDVLTLKGGTVEGDFKAACGAYYDYTSSTKEKPMTFFKRVLRKLKLYTPKYLESAFVTDLANNQYDVIYANTVVSIPVGVQLKAASSTTKLIAHVHELSAVIQMLVPDFREYQSTIDAYIVPSQLVKKDLITAWNVAEENVEVIYECALVNIQKQSVGRQNDKKRFVVGASGLVHWRKGYDVFIQLASIILNKYPDISIDFVWVGRIPKKEHIIINEDLRKLGLSDCISFVGEVENTVKHYSDFDVFVMTSREDPFPLVCIEVGLLGKPIISFDKAVGTNEILEKGGGFIVPYLDIPKMAEKIMMYYNNSELKEAHGKHNVAAFSQFTPDKICPELYQQIQTTIAK